MALSVGWKVEMGNAHSAAAGDIRAADGSGSRGQGKSVGHWGLRLAAHKGLLRAGNLTIDLCPRRW